MVCEHESMALLTSALCLLKVVYTVSTVLVCMLLARLMYIILCTCMRIHHSQSSRSPTLMYHFLCVWA